MQLNNVRLFSGEPDSDERFLELVQDPVKRQEQLKGLEQNRTWAKRSSGVFLGLFFLMGMAGLAQNNLRFYFPYLALDFAMFVGATVQHSAADTKIKLIKLYALLTQNSEHAA